MAELRKRILLKALFGVETEHHVVVLDRTGRALPRERMVPLFGNALARRLAARSLSFKGGRRDWALCNGARVYYDSWCNSAGEVQGSFEYSTAEHTDLRDVVADVRGGQRLLLRVASDIRQRTGLEVEVYTSGVDCLTGKSTATHLSYWRPVREPARELTPHFASLPLICGTGGLSSAAVSGSQFVFSPRAELIEKATSSSSNGRRGLVDTYPKPLCHAGWRIQDINADGNHSDLQLAVRVGSTALLLALLDADQISLDDLQISKPVSAIRTFNRNPTATWRLVSGRECSALELQTLLCDRVADALADDSIEAPAWAAWLMTRWRKLIQLAAGDGPPGERMVLDWVVVQSGLQDICRELNIEWDWLRTTHEALIQAHESGLDRSRVLRLEGDQLPRLQLERVLASRNMDWTEFVRTLTLLPELQAFATAFLRLGPAGLYQQLRTHNLVPESDVIDAARITRAQSLPPETTRARLRGDFVRRNAGKRGYSVRWDRLVSPDETIEIPEPFDGPTSVKSAARSSRDERQSSCPGRPGETGPVQQT